MSSPSGVGLLQRRAAHVRRLDAASTAAASARRPRRAARSPAALGKTLPGGEVIVLDSAPYDVITITQPVSILAAAGIFAGVSALPGQSAITIAAGPTDKRLPARARRSRRKAAQRHPVLERRRALSREHDRSRLLAGGAGRRQLPAGRRGEAVRSRTAGFSRARRGCASPTRGSDVGVIVDNVRFENNGTGHQGDRERSAHDPQFDRRRRHQDGISLAGANGLPLTAAFDRCSSPATRGRHHVGRHACRSTRPSAARRCAATAVPASSCRGATAVGHACHAVDDRSQCRPASATGAGGSMLSRGNNTVEANNADGSFSGTYSGK